MTRRKTPPPKIPKEYTVEPVWMHDWSESEPKSFGNDFTSHYNGEPSGFARLSSYDKMGLAATETVTRNTLAGKDMKGLHALSKRDSRGFNTNQISIDPNPQASRDKTAKLRGKPNTSRSA